jgi:hypothetical protein
VVWLTENDWSGSFKSQTLAMIPKNRWGSPDYLSPLAIPLWALLSGWENRKPSSPAMDNHPACRWRRLRGR